MRTFQHFLMARALAVSLLASTAAAQTRFTTLYNFGGTDPVGVSAVGGNVFASAWQISGLTDWSCGTISELQPTGGGSWLETTLYTFPQDGSEGCYPTAAPIPGPGGALYGTTLYGGAYGYGVLYEIQPPAAPGGAWTESLLYAFNESGGGTGNPEPLVPGPNGSFYCGLGGGAYGFGALVQLFPPSAPGGSWTETVLYSPPSFGTGFAPFVVGPGGVVYGTNSGGPIGQYSPPAAPGGSWTETTLYTVPASEGLSPNSLTLAGDGTLYGTTLGSNYDYGPGKATVFQLKPPTLAGGTWGFTVLHDFGTQLNLNSPLILRNGNLYGTAASATGGQVFELQHPATAGAWTLVHLYQFTGNQLPGGALVMDKSGGFFGVTAAPYLAPPSGTVYRLATK